LFVELDPSRRPWSAVAGRRVDGVGGYFCPVLTADTGDWQRASVSGAPLFCTVRYSSVDRDHSDYRPRRQCGSRYRDNAGDEVALLFRKLLTCPP